MTLQLPQTHTSSATSTSSEKMRRILRRTWCLLALAELVLIGLISLQLSWMKSLIYSGMEETVRDQLYLLDMQYNLKIHQMVRIPLGGWC